MEPLSALSVAAAVVQFVEFTGKIIGSAFELRDSVTGELAHNLEIEEITRDLQAQAQQLSSRSSQVPSAKFSPVAQKAIKLSDELLDVLSSLRLNHAGSFRSWAALQTAIRSLLKASKIESLQGRLDNLRTEMMLQINVALWHKQTDVYDMLCSVDRRCESMRLDLLAQTSQLRQGIHDELVRQSEEFASLLKDAQKGSAFAKLVRLVQSEAAESRRTQSGTCARRFGAVVDRTEQMVLEADFNSDIMQFLQSLRFKEMPKRKDKISKTYKRTYTWIFDRKKSTFADWLSSATGIFWLTGRAGSGKSTLMKFLDEEERTKDALRRWVRKRELEIDTARKVKHENAPPGFQKQGLHKRTPANIEDDSVLPQPFEASQLGLVTASFFFWNAGTSMQKSQQGLLQSLCYQVFAACPDLVQELCPERWSARKSYLPSPEWTTEELEYVLRQALIKAGETTLFCFFIDGLDEYEGEDPYALVSLINRLRECASVKFCVSSRPWNVFRTEYVPAAAGTLTLEHFTKDDMTEYIYGNLQTDPRFLRLAKQDSRAHDLAVEVSERANGVFFWVFLVVQDLLRGMNESDDILTLQKRLRTLPTDLADYFQHMLERLDRVYRERTAQTLLVALTALNPVSAISIYCLEHDRTLSGFLKMALIQAHHPNQHERIREAMRSLTNKWCRDLCSISNDEPFGYLEFLHRTVIEFLNSESIYRTLQEQAGSGFSIRTMLCRTYLAQLSCATSGRTDVFGSLTDKEIITMARSIMFFAKECEVYESQCLSGELEELDRLENILPLRANNYVTAATAQTSIPSGADFLAWAVSCDLRLYVDIRLSKQPDLLFRKGASWPLIDYAFTNGLSEFPGTSANHEDMVRMLVEHATAYDRRAKKHAKCKRFFSIMVKQKRQEGPASSEFMRGSHPTRFVAPG